MPGFPSVVTTNSKKSQDFPQSFCPFHFGNNFLLDVTDRPRGSVLLLAYLSGDFVNFSKNFMSLQALGFIAGWEFQQVS